jgi:hypothetical protein
MHRHQNPVKKQPRRAPLARPCPFSRRTAYWLQVQRNLLVAIGNLTAARLAPLTGDTTTKEI